eukprot:96724-Alexandrium_andersonii.AAC.1
MHQHLAKWRSIVAQASAKLNERARAHHAKVASVKPGRGDAIPENGQPMVHMRYECGRTFKHNAGL